MKNHRTCIGIVGGAGVAGEMCRQAYDVGMHCAMNNAVVVCGGLGGIMEAAARGAAENGGTVVGIIPSADKGAANPFVHIVIPSGMGIARNVLVVQTADVLIAFPGAYGTLSEMGLGLASGKTIIFMPGAWDLRRVGTVESARFKEAVDPRHAVGLALEV